LSSQFKHPNGQVVFELQSMTMKEPGTADTGPGS
jgi:hypothetical protein